MLGRITRERKYNRILFYLAYTLYFVVNYVEMYTAVNAEEFLKILHLFKYVSYALFLIITGWRFITNQKPLLYKCIGWTLLIAAIGYQVIFHSSNSIVMVLIISYAFAEDNIQGFSIWNLCLNVVMYIFTLLSVPSGLGENVMMVDDIKLGISRSRNSCGFNYPGQMSMSLMPVLFLYYYIRGKKITIFENIGWFILIGIAFAANMTIMPSLIMICFILFFSYENYRKRFNDPKREQRKKYIPYIAYASAGITFILTWLYSNDVPIAMGIDKLISHRLQMNDKGIVHIGITLLGTGYKNGYSLGWYLYLDSEYFYMLISNGIIYTIVAIWMWKAVIEWSVKAQDDIMTLIFCFMAVNAIVNNGIFNLMFLPFIIVLYQALESKFKGLLSTRRTGNENYVFDNIT